MFLRNVFMYIHMHGKCCYGLVAAARFDHNHNNYSLKRKSTSPSRYHHYPSEDMCEFQVMTKPVFPEGSFFNWVLSLQGNSFIFH
jgi:hypothetical protein